MKKEDIIKQVDFIISVGLFKIEDSIKILQFRSDLEDMAADVVISTEKATAVVERTKEIEKKKTEPKITMVDDDRPF